MLCEHKAMDLIQLRYFQAVARHQHVSRAAAELRVAQPALSRAIARLEAELGVPLFDRRGRRVRLNRFGAMFLARAGRALDELDQGQHELRDAAGLAQGTVAVAAETLRTLSGLVAGFLAGHPGVRFRLFQSPAPAMAAQLQAGEVDLCLASQPLPGLAHASAGLVSIELLSEEVLLAVPPSHRLAGPHPGRGRRAGRRAVRHHPARLLAARSHRPALHRRGHRVRGRRALRHPRPDQRRGRHRADAGHGQAACA